MLTIDRRTFWTITALVVLLVAASYLAGYGTGQLRLYHEVFMEDIELYPVPVDELPERGNSNDTTIQTRSAHARSD